MQGVVEGTSGGGRDSRRPLSGAAWWKNVAAVKQAGNLRIFFTTNFFLPKKLGGFLLSFYFELAPGRRIAFTFCQIYQ